MGIGNPIFLLFSFFIIAVILMYFFRKQYHNKVVSSNLLWEEIMKEWQASPWFHKLQKNLLLFLQVLILLLLMFALTKPYILSEMTKKDHIIILLDTSASMNATVNNQSHFDLAKKEIESIIKKADGKITLLAVGRTITTVISNESNDQVVLDKLKEVKKTNNHENMKKAIHLGEALSLGSESIIHVFSDSLKKESIDDLELASPIQVHNLLPNPKNVSLQSFGIHEGESRNTGVATIENQSNEKVKGKFVVWNAEKEIFSESITLEAKEEKIIPLSNLSKNIIYKGEIVFNNDDYKEDNTLSNLQEISKPPVYVIGEINPFLLKGFQSIGVEVKSIQSLQEEGYEKGVVLTTKQNWQHLSISNPSFIVPGVSSSSTRLEGGIETKGDDPILKHVEFNNVYIEKGKNIQIAELDSLVDSESATLIQKGERKGQRLILLNFQLEDSDFPLHPDFPIFLYNAYQYLSENQDFLGYFQPNEQRTLSLAQGENKKWELYSLENEFIGEWKTNDRFIAPSSPGVYQAIDGNKRKYFSVEIDEREKKPSTGSTFTLKSTKKTENKKSESTPKTLLKGFLILAIILLFIEWEVYRRGT